MRWCATKSPNDLHSSTKERSGNWIAFEFKTGPDTFQQQGGEVEPDDRIHIPPWQSWWIDSLDFHLVRQALAYPPIR